MKAEYEVTYSFYDKGFRGVVIKASEILSGKRFRKEKDLYRAMNGDVSGFILNYYKFVVKYRRKPKIKLY